MPCYVAKFGEEQYLIWSTIVDAPTSRIMSREETLAELYSRKEEGKYRLTADPESCLELADRYGASHKDGLEELLELNRAGEYESTLTKEEIIQKYKTKGV